MPLPTEFQFSQASLQDFVTCARRFKLRYLDKLRWPAVETEPVAEAERLARLGTDFHRLVHQHLVGLDVDTLTATLELAEPDLKRWWHNYLAYRPPELTGARLYPELSLSTPLRGYRLLARFDVLATASTGALYIIDWKTAHHRPAREALARRLQSRVYPFVLATAGAAFNGGRPVDPAAIKMIYWYPQFPDQPEIFDYDHKQQARDEQFLSELVQRVTDAAERADFPLVEDPTPCTYCVYRSLCDRGVQAGPLAPNSEDTIEEFDELALDWDQIAEIQF
jgi:hypothetical protein